MKRNLLLGIALLLGAAFTVKAQSDLSYQNPPEEIANLIEAPRTPGVLPHEGGEWILLFDRPAYPDIEQVAQDELRLAGTRINPQTNGQSRSYHYINLRLLDVETKAVTAFKGLPESPKLENFRISPDEAYIAFTHTTDAGIELWVASIANTEARKLTGPVVNDALPGRPYEWTPDSKTLVFKSVLQDRGAPPEENPVPDGPVVQENTGGKAPVRTYQDLLETPHDQALFTYYASSVLKKTDLQGRTSSLGHKGIIRSVDASPNGKYLKVNTIHKPFSYIVPYYRFPFTVDILTPKGDYIAQIASIPLAEDVPKGFGSVRTGPRNFQWRADAPAEIYWVEAQDEGDAMKEAEVRDKLFVLDEPFDGEPQPVLSLKNRYGGISWGNKELAMVSSWWWSNRNLKTIRFYPGDPDKGKTIIFDRSFEDRYNDPGNFLMKRDENGFSRLVTTNGGNTLFLVGEGASPEGNRPFLDRFDLESGESERLWRSKAPYYEQPYELIDTENLKLITRREAVREQPNYFLRDLKNESLKQLTEFPHPYPQLKDIHKELLKYSRKDGVQLTGTLYLPYKEEEKNKNLPVVMWAYPREYKSAKAAGQVKDSPYRFDRIGWWSPLVWLTQGYAVLDDPSMPIIGEGDEEPNDTFVPQLVSSAKAGIDTLAEMGVADTSRIAIGGHSYGAFMTANLLAHSDMFAAGIARSGAYNRTLTPFGFQAEERTFWEASDVYFTMSPFMHADKIKEPMLLIHGKADNNSGTFPMQSERFYSALKGHGARVRLVMLPEESHSYRARQSILHMLWESHQWLEQFVKNK